MLVSGLKAEVDEYIATHSGERDESGKALVVRNGVAEPRRVTTTAGELEIRVPRVDDRRQDSRFTSAILPPWARRSPKVSEVLPVLYLRGISTKDFVPALSEFFGSEAGLSASTIQRLTREWSGELKEFGQRDLSQVDPVYLWADRGKWAFEDLFERDGLSMNFSGCRYDLENYVAAFEAANLLVEKLIEPPPSPPKETRWNRVPNCLMLRCLKPQ